jgi:hypothetical protein
MDPEKADEYGSHLMFLREGFNQTAGDLAAKTAAATIATVEFETQLNNLTPTDVQAFGDDLESRRKEFRGLRRDLLNSQLELLDVQEIVDKEIDRAQEDSQGE